MVSVSPSAMELFLLSSPDGTPCPCSGPSTHRTELQMSPRAVPVPHLLSPAAARVGRQHPLVPHPPITGSSPTHHWLLTHPSLVPLHPSLAPHPSPPRWELGSAKGSGGTWSSSTSPLQLEQGQDRFQDVSPNCRALTLPSVLICPGSSQRGERFLSVCGGLMWVCRDCGGNE